MGTIQKMENEEVKRVAMMFSCASYFNSLEHCRKTDFARFLCFCNWLLRTGDPKFGYFRNLHGLIPLLYIRWCVNKKVRIESRHPWGKFSLVADIVTWCGRVFLGLSMLSWTKLKDLILTPFPLIPMPEGDDARKQLVAVLKMCERMGLIPELDCVRIIGDRCITNMGPDGLMCLFADLCKTAGCTVGADAAHGFVSVCVSVCLCPCLSYI
jgi:hypothetical protein